MQTNSTTAKQRRRRTTQPGEISADSPKKRRSRSQKDRPQDVDQLVTAIRSDRLDGRCNAAKQIVEARAMIAEAPEQVALALVYDTLATGAVILAAVVKELSRPESIMVNGELNPLVHKHYFEVQKSILRSVDALNRLRKGNGIEDEDKGSAQPIDISTLILEANHQ